MLTEPRVLNRALSALKTAKVYLTATKPRTMRTLPGCLTLDNDLNRPEYQGGQLV